MRHVSKTWVPGRRWRVVGRVSPVRVSLLLLATVISVTAVLATAAAAAGGYELPWWSVDGGGGTSSRGAYSLRGTAGQPDAGVMSGGTYTLGGGSWAGTGGEPPKPFKIVLPLVLSGQ